MRRSFESVRGGALTRLGRNFAEGQLSPSTFERRVGDVLVTEVPAELDDVLWDLPARHGLGWRRRAPERIAFEEPPWQEIVLGPRPFRRWLLGRDAGCDVVLALRSVSRRHAELTVRGGVCVVRDLGSVNGTWVNGDRVLEARLRAGDHLHLGGLLAVVA